MLETCTLDFSTEDNSLKSELFALRVFLYDSRMNVPWRSQDDRPGERVLELLEEKWFSNTHDRSFRPRPLTHDHDRSGDGPRRGARRRLHAVDTPEQHAMRPVLFSPIDEEPCPSADACSGHGSVSPETLASSPLSFSGHRYETEVDSYTSGGTTLDDGEISCIDIRGDCQQQLKRSRISVDQIVSRVCAAISLMVFVAEVCMDLAGCLVDFILMRR